MKKVAASLALIALASAGCGGEGSRMTSGGGGDVGDADPADVRVIDAWADTLRRGDIDGAARYFAIPSTAENGSLLIPIGSLADARLFNESLPCGARLIRAVSTGELTTATFRLTERPGPGTCGGGTGETAKTSFLIEAGKIVEWRRVGVGEPQAPGQAI